jgi:hypothetical protein
MKCLNSAWFNGIQFKIGPLHTHDYITLFFQTEHIADFTKSSEII